MKDLIIRTVYGFLFALVVAGSILIDKWLLAILLILVVGFGTDEMIRLRINARPGFRDSLLMISVPVLLFGLLAAVALQLLPLKFLTLSIIILLFPFLHALFSKQYSFTDLAGMYWPTFFLVALPSGLMLFFYSDTLLGDIAGSYLLLSVIILAGKEVLEA